MLAELLQSASEAFRLQATGLGNGGKTKQLTPPYCSAKSHTPLWVGCSTVSAPSAAGGMEVSRIDVDMISEVCYTPRPVFPVGWGAH